jgi:hypothetical protein
MIYTLQFFWLRLVSERELLQTQFIYLFEIFINA